MSGIKYTLLGVTTAAVMIAAPLGVSAHNRDKDDQQDTRRQEEFRRQHQNNDNNRSKAFWHKQHGDEDKAKTCEERQASLNQKVADFKAAAQKDMVFQVSYYGFLQNFVTTQNISVSNYAELKAKVEAKELAAAQAVDVVTAPDLNCDEQNPNIDAKANDSLGQARAALNDYKRALRNFENSIRVAYHTQTDVQ